MAGRGPVPKDERVRPGAPSRGEWRPAPGIGWQHGEVPRCPTRSVAAQETWATWFGAWYASYWLPADLPNLRLLIKLWARADSGKARGADLGSLRLLMDDLGITRKGQQDRRWKRPEPASMPSQHEAPSPYAHLKVVAG